VSDIGEKRESFKTAGSSLISVSRRSDELTGSAKPLSLRPYLLSVFQTIWQPWRKF
jgi:hypothetical protein